MLGKFLSLHYCRSFGSCNIYGGLSQSASGNSTSSLRTTTFICKYKANEMVQYHKENVLRVGMFKVQKGGLRILNMQAENINKILAHD